MDDEAGFAGLVCFCTASADHNADFRHSGRMSALPSPPPTAARWATAIRPRSLPVAIGPVLTGIALAWQQQGHVDGLLAMLALAAALLMQVITNLQNDVGYTVRGGECSGTRVGLPRATAQGWLSIKQVRWAVVGVSLLALALGLTIVALRGWPVLVIGGASLLGALAYMGGPRPIAYTPLGEFTVLVFFGLVAVLGTQWLLSGQVSLDGLLAATAVGCWAAAALCVNNHRDIDHDRQSGRRTFAVVFGARASHRLFSGLTLGPVVLLIVLATTLGPSVLLPLGCVPAAWRLGRDLRHCRPGLGYNVLLFRTFQLGLVQAALLALGIAAA